MSDENPYDVQVGQVWEDCDWRMYGRRITVLAIDGGRATVESTTGARTKIRLSRFRPNSTGYKLVKP